MSTDSSMDFRALTEAAALYLRAATAADEIPGRGIGALQEASQRQRADGDLAAAQKTERMIESAWQDPVGYFFGRDVQGKIRPPHEWPLGDHEWQPSLDPEGNLRLAQNYIEAAQRELKNKISG